MEQKHTPWPSDDAGAIAALKRELAKWDAAIDQAKAMLAQNDIVLEEDEDSNPNAVMWTAKGDLVSFLNLLGIPIPE